MPNIIESYLTIVNTPLGPAVLVNTADSIRYDQNTTLKEALLVLHEQISKASGMVATNTADLLAIKTWLTENYNYVPGDTLPETSTTYLTPAFVELSKVPSDNTPVDETIDSAQG